MTKLATTLLAIMLLAGCGTMGYPQSRSQRLTDFQSRYPNTTAETLAKIRQGTIAIGMSSGEVMAAWGQPQSCIKDTNGIMIWRYSGSLLTFTNYILTDAVQQTR